MQSTFQGQNPLPPLRIDSTIQLAWGLSLNFSHEKTQEAVGQGFLDWFKTFRATCEKDKIAQKYVDNLSAILASYLRSSAFERETYVAYLDTYDDLHQANVKTINDIVDLTTPSSSGILGKLGVFLGLGSLTEIVDRLIGIVPPTAGLPFNISILLGAGVVWLIVALLLLKLSQGWLIKRSAVKSWKKQTYFWKKHAKPAFMRELLLLLVQLRGLVKNFDKNYQESIIKLDEDQILKLTELDVLKDYVENGSNAKLQPDELNLLRFIDNTLPDKNLYENIGKDI